MAAPIQSARVTSRNRCCVAEGIVTQRDILSFKRTYLRDCAFHRELWDAADKRARATEERDRYGS